MTFDFEYRNSGIQNIYGLEIRIARELFDENRKNNVPSDLLDHCLSKRVKKELRYPQILREEEIAVCSSQGIDVELICALYNMIGKGETGLYPDLNRNWAKIEQTIMEYIDYLKEE